MLSIKRKAKNIQKNLGTRAAAGYLRNKGITLEGALITLFGRVR